MSRSQRRAMIDREEPKLSLVRSAPCWVSAAPSCTTCQPRPAPWTWSLMALIDQQYLKTPFYGSRRMTAWLSNHGHQVNRKRVRRLTRLIGLEAIYRVPTPASQTQGIRSIRTYSGGWRSTGSTRCGPPQSPTYPWLGVSSTWWPS